MKVFPLFFMVPNNFSKLPHDDISDASWSSMLSSRYPTKVSPRSVKATHQECSNLGSSSWPLHKHFKQGLHKFFKVSSWYPTKDLQITSSRVFNFTSTSHSKVVFKSILKQLQMHFNIYKRLSRDVSKYKLLQTNVKYVLPILEAEFFYLSHVSLLYNGDWPHFPLSTTSTGCCTSDHRSINWAIITPQVRVIWKVVV